VPVVIVPGGGAFADAVRDAQAAFHFPDAVAHQMALLAMHQTGLILAALHPRLTPFETLAELRRALARDQIPVWLPLKLVQRDARVSANWSTTSDGLAARLAERIGRVPVVLVKSCRIACGTSLAALVRLRVVDPTFAAIVDRARLQWRVFGEGDAKDLAGLVEACTRAAYRRRYRPRDAGRRVAPGRAIARHR
jgi:aspartokinase-like uncharacterized kinase